MMHQRHGPALGGWAWLALLLATLAVLLTDANRFLPPVGEKFVDSFKPASIDLIPNFNAALALLKGKNPYHHRLPDLSGPRFEVPGSKRPLTYVYPPSHALLYVPIVLLAGADFARATRIQFFLSLGLLLLLAVAVSSLLAAILDCSRDLRLAFIPISTFLLALNPGSQLGLERGQSDLLTAACCWCAVVLLVHRHFGAAAFLAIAGVLLKGYGLVFALGALALAVNRSSWRAVALGISVALVVLLLPVARYVPDAIDAYRVRRAMFWSGWNNQGFLNVAYTFRPSVSLLWHKFFTGLALVAAAASWLQLARVVRSGADDRQRALWLSLFAFAALAVPIGYSRNSFAYNGVIILPGALVLALAQARFLSSQHVLARLLVGAWIAGALVGLFAFNFERALGLPPVARELPTFGVALIALLALVAVTSIHALVRRPGESV